ncbi:hypothetical protein F383_17474 [Gossypium arboreum]|uniref:Uncharacterized protein n=1 Tax=Gossypium arboreum TaxID=29729 RepID=A0A0B0NMW2_GOSAR|nr:hypothetical protein F383_17474 [Gossypium arboreum]
MVQRVKEVTWLRKRLVQGDTSTYETYSSIRLRKFNEMVFDHFLRHEKDLWLM